MTIASFAEANQYLARFYDNSRAHYTLDNMRQLMAYLGNPQEKIKVVHVAGTSGKTSTSYYAAALLQTAGFKTGLTISPHVDEINERVQIDGRPLPEIKFCRALNEFLELVEAGPVQQPSWFEVMVAFAYWYFAIAEVDYAVVEVGLGGLKDGTNVIKRADKVCIITDIGLDHTTILGNTLPEIAAQKAGIIQPGNQVFMYRQGPEVVAVAKSAAIAQAADLKLINPSKITPLDLPVFQQRNFNLALQTVNYILKREGRQLLNQEQVKTVSSQTYIPGRMEIIHFKGKTVILDGAHNAQKLQTLIDSLRVKYGSRPLAVLASFADSDMERVEGAMAVLGGLTKTLITTPFVTSKDYLKKSMDLAALAEIGLQHGISIDIQPDAAAAFSKLLKRPEEILLVTGSFYLLNHIRPLMLKV